MNPELKCGRCGITNQTGATFCGTCGASLMQIGQGHCRPEPPKTSRAMVSLLLGIGGFLCLGPLLSVPGMIVAKSELNAIRDGRAHASGQGLAKAGFWVSTGATVVTVVGCMIGGLIMVGLPLLAGF